MLFFSLLIYELFVIIYEVKSIYKYYKNRNFIIIFKYLYAKRRSGMLWNSE